MNVRANAVMRQSKISFKEWVNAPISAKQNALKSIQPSADMFLGFIISSMDNEKLTIENYPFTLHINSHAEPACTKPMLRFGGGRQGTT